MDEFLRNIAGAQKLFDWFGYWPSFHDAEILSLALNRSGVSDMRILTWEMTNEIDEKGFYVLQKHTIVRFIFEEIIDLELSGFSDQNVIFGLSLRPIAEGTRIALDPCCGLAGNISARNISVELEPVRGALEP